MILATTHLRAIDPLVFNLSVTDSGGLSEQYRTYWLGSNQRWSTEQILVVVLKLALVVDFIIFAMAVSVVPN